MKKTLRIASFILAFLMLIPNASDLPLFFNEIIVNAEESQGVVQEETIDTTTVEQENPETYYSFPDEMRATYITPGKDYFKDNTQSMDKTIEEINNIMKNIDSYEMNTVIINTSYEGVAYYDIEKNILSETSPVKLLIDAARENALYVYVNFDMNFVLNQLVDADLTTRINSLVQKSHKFSGKYLVDGIILDGYYSTKSVSSYNEYMNIGAGMGFENWLLENGAYAFSLVSDAIHKTNNTIPVGISITNMWANSSTDASGSNTSDSFQALKDGYADTVSYIKKGFADFIVLKTTGSITDESLPFKDVLTWWAGYADSSQIPLFTHISNEKICTTATGWISPDQIIKQLEYAKTIKGFQGCAFNSYSSLISNSGSSTKALVNYYLDDYNLNSLNKELTMTLPLKYTYTTYEPVVKFQGTFDDNFEVYFDGKIIELNDAGNFYYEKELSVGVNKFTIKNKANTVTYKITRKVKVLKSIAPTNDMKVEEKTKLSISAIAYKESVVTATLNGQTIQLTQTEGEYEGSDPNSNYAKFVGSFTAPAGIVNKEQNLGNIVINGSYLNFVYESATGGSIVVNALPEVFVTDPAKLIEVTTDNAMTYDYYTTNNIANPKSPRLPAGTLDYYIKKVSYDDIEYYLTQSGKRIKATDAKVIDGFTFGSNKLTVTDAYKDNNDTVIKLSMDTSIPFTIKYEPCDFYTWITGDYFVKNFQATTVIVEFDYITDIVGDVILPSNSLFSSASWDVVTYGDVKKYQLRLKLTQAGIFAGITTSYNEEDELTLRFNGYRNNLNGAVIVVDPGHGYSRSATVLDPGAVGHVTEQVVNLAIAKKLTAKLQAAGATVYMLPTNTQYINVYERSSYARQYNPDMFISIHSNAVTNGEGVRGTEVHYFTPFSQPLANAIVTNMASYYQNSVYKDGKNRNRGTFYNYFAVTLQHDFPSVLIECGFVTDKTEAMALNSETHQNGLADAMVTGIKSYFALNTTT